MFGRNIFLLLIIAALAVSTSYYFYILYSQSHLPIQEYDIENVDFFGINAGKLYNVKADYVVKTGKDLYKLTNISGVYYLDAAKTDKIFLSSSTGFFNNEKNLLDLTDKVQLDMTGGYSLITDSCQIDTNRKLANAKNSVLIRGMQGEVISKEGGTLFWDNKKILLHGPINSMFFID